MSSSSATEKAEKADKEEKAPAPSRYPLRVDVAKPTVIYQPSFSKDKDPTKPSPSKAAEAPSPGGGSSTPGRERVLGKNHGELAGSLNNVAVLLMDLKRYEEALPVLRRAARLSQAGAGKAHPQYATALGNLAKNKGQMP